jgi:AraC-binding-like domain
MPPTKPLDRFSVIRTRNVEELRAKLAQIYTNPVLAPEGRSRTFDIAFNNYQIRHIGMSFIKYGSAVRLELPHTDYISQVFPLNGSGIILNNKETVPMTAYDSAINSNGISHTARFDAAYEQVAVRINPAAARKHLAAMTGASINAPLRFDSASNFVRPEARMLRRHFLFVVKEISSASAPLPSLMLTEFEQTLMTLFMLVNRHNYSHLLERRTPDAGASQVRRAEEYIAASADRAITVEDISEVTGASALSLLHSFKRRGRGSPRNFANRLLNSHKGKH